MDINRDIKKAAQQLRLGKGDHRSLKKAQIQAIQAAVSGDDVFLVAPTGFGKSAVFQITALLRGGVTLVLVPLLSLLRDQVRRLQNLGISAGYFCSEAGSMTEDEILQTLEKEEYLILYSTPESLPKLRWLDAWIRTLVVDECHCVTMWGYTFRKAYLSIGSILCLFSHRPVVLAMTATAPPEIRQEMEHLLTMCRVCHFQVPLHRKNLTFVIQPAESKKQREKALKKLLAKHLGESVIIYCPTKAMTDRVYGMVNTWYPGQVAKSHSEAEGRNRNEEAFLSGQQNIIVATNAFGMGVDKPDIRLVVLYGLPLSPLDFYQQAGRGGRDGKKATCVLLYRDGDYQNNLRILEQSGTTAQGREALDSMKEIADSDECIVRQTLMLLGEDTASDCGKCSSCQRKRRKKA